MKCLVIEMNEETQKKMFEFQLLQSHLQELQRRQQLVAERIGELVRTKAAFEELKTVKAGDAAMIPLGGENFIPGKITDTKNVLVGVGGGIAIRKSADAAAETLDGRIREMEHIADSLMGEVQSIVGQLTRIQTELEAQNRKSAD